MSTVKNTADLRKMLLETIDGVRKKKIDSNQAHAIATLSGKILQSAKLDLDILRLSLRNEQTGQTEVKALQLISEKLVS